MWKAIKRNANPILLTFNLVGVVILLGSALYGYYYVVWSIEGKEPVRLAIERTIDIYALGHRLNEYYNRFGVYPCMDSDLPCDWQIELAKVQPGEPNPTDPETDLPYVYLANVARSAVAVRMYRSPAMTICEKEGGESIWLVYFGGEKKASLECATQVFDPFR